MSTEINLRKTAFIGVGLMLWAMVFGIAETLYFGSNWYPKSHAELFCDYLTATINGAGMGLFIFCLILRVKQIISTT